MGNSLGVAELEFFEWLDDDDGGQDPYLLLDFWLAFPGIPSLEELAILKRKVKDQFPPAKVEAKPLKKRKKAGMVWNVARVQEVEARAEELGLHPWEVVEIRKKSWEIGLRKLRATLHKKG